MSRYVSNYLGMTAPRKTQHGFTRTLVAADGQTLIASCLPECSRNDATVKTWTLGNDIRAGRI